MMVSNALLSGTTGVTESAQCLVNVPGICFSTPYLADDTVAEREKESKGSFSSEI